jgi:hypothetical protein
MMLDIRCVMLYNRIMRTTLDIDPQVLAKIRLLSRQRSQSLGRVASELLAAAMEPKETPRSRNGVPVFPAASGLSPDMELVNRLRD